MPDDEVDLEQEDIAATAAETRGPAPVGLTENYFDRFDAADRATSFDLAERFRLTKVNSYYRGTILGSGQLENMARVHEALSTLSPEDAMKELNDLIPANVKSPERSALARRLLRQSAGDERLTFLKGQQEKYLSVVNDLRRYEAMPNFSGIGEGTIALAGGFAGGALSPENWIGFPVTGGSLAVRAAKFGLQQAGMAAPVDYAVQQSNIRAHVRDEYDIMQTALAPGFAFVIGGGLYIGAHGAGKLISGATAKRQYREMGIHDDGARTINDVAEPTTAALDPKLVELLGNQEEVRRQLGTMGQQIVEAKTVQERNAIAGNIEKLKEQEKGFQDQIDEFGVPPDELGFVRRKTSKAPEGYRFPGEQQETAGAPIVSPTEPVKVRQAKMEEAVRENSVKSLQQMTTEMAKALNLPVRQGRVQISGAFGTYSSKTGVIRVAEVPDFETVVHELGHGIEFTIGKKELTQLAQSHIGELGPLDYDPSQKRWYEGFAEWIRYYVGNPAYAQKQAPQFTAAFKAHMMQNHPEVLQTLDRFSAAYNAYTNADATMALDAMVVSGRKPGFFERIRKEIAEDKMAPTVMNYVHKFYEAGLDQYAPMERAVDALGRGIKAKTGEVVPLKAADDPSHLIRGFNRSANAGLIDSMRGVVPYHEVESAGPSLADAISHAIGEPSRFGNWSQEKLDIFNNYLVARRGRVLWEKHANGELPNPPLARGNNMLAHDIAEIEKTYPDMAHGADMVHEWTRNLLKKKYEGGLIDKKLYEKLLEEEFYVPLRRDVSDKPLAAEATTKGGPAQAEQIKRQRGSARDVINPIESLMMDSFQTNRAIQHNDIIRSLARLAEKAGVHGGEIFEPIKSHQAQAIFGDIEQALKDAASKHGGSQADIDHMMSTVTNFFGGDPIVGTFFKSIPTLPRGEPIVFYREGGKLKAGRVISKDEGMGVYELLTEIPSATRDAWVNMMSKVSLVQRAGIVTHPMYAYNNYVADQLQAFVLEGQIPVIGGLRGISEELTQGIKTNSLTGRFLNAIGLKNKGYATLYAMGGGPSAGAAIAPLEAAVERDIQALAKQGYLVNKTSSLKGALELLSFPEAGTRNAIFGRVYEQGLKDGLSRYEALQEGLMTARDATIDFDRHGSHTRELRSIFNFANTWLQSMDKLRRAMVTPIGAEHIFSKDVNEYNRLLARWTRWGGIGLVLGGSYAALNAHKSGYRDASPELMGANFVTPLGDDKIWLTKKPFEHSIWFTMGEYAYLGMMEGDKRAAGLMKDALIEAMKPPNPLTAVPFISTPIELATGKSIFTGKDIVPERLQKKTSPLQYDESTSEFAKALGKVTGLSPKKVDYAAGSFLGTWGRDLMALSAGRDEDSPVKSAVDQIFIRRNLKNPQRTDVTRTQFWKFMGKTTGEFRQANQDFMDYVQRGRDADATAYFNKLDEDKKVFVALQSSGSDEIKGKLNTTFTPNDRRMHPLNNAYTAVGVLSKIQMELTENAFKHDGDFVKMPGDKRRSLIDAVSLLSHAHLFNALVGIGQPGYDNRQPRDLQLLFDVVKDRDPRVAERIANDFATGNTKVYSPEELRKIYPEIKKRILEQGYQAELGDLTDPVIEEGTEFGGVKQKKPSRRRIEIKGAQ